MILLYIISIYIALGLLTLGYLYTFERTDIEKVQKKSFEENNTFTRPFIDGLMNLVIIGIWPYMVYCTVSDAITFMKWKVRARRIDKIIKKMDSKDN